MSVFQHFSTTAAGHSAAAAVHAPHAPTANWVDGEIFANPWLVQELLMKHDNDASLLFDSAPHHENHVSAPVAFTGLPAELPDDLFNLGAPEESTDSSSASSPSSASTAPEVPAFDAPAGSPAFGAPIYHVETKIEMAGVPSRKATENAPSVSNKRKNSTSSARKETDAKAAAPAPMSKRARANERNRKREAHNQAERERRDDLKEGYAGLRMVLPTDLCPDRKNQVELLQAAVKFISLLQADYERIRKEKLELQAQLALAAAGLPITPAPSS